MIPNTKNDLPAMACVSGMQKAIRRGLEREAMEFACELLHSSKGFHTLVCNRLEIISHEDCDAVGQPWLVPLVATCVAQAKVVFDIEKPGRARMFLGTAIRAMCRAAKSREGDHFALAVGLNTEVGGYVPEIPEWANDMHTLKGKQMGRGLKHFREDAAKLHPKAKKDAYEDEAYRLLELKLSNKSKKKVAAGDLFEE